MKKTILLLTTLATLLFGACSAEAFADRPVSPDKLPQLVKDFVKQTFPGRTISYAEKEGSFAKVWYEVHLNDGTEIDIKGNGEWDTVDCKFTAVPASLIPETIAQYVAANFPGSDIVKIDKEYFGYEVELNIDLELKFSKDGTLRRIDD